MKLVALDSSTPLASFALFDGDALVSEHELTAPHAHGEVLLPALASAMSAAGWKAKDVARWVVGVGPGSFTGARIGVSLVKGIALSTGAEVVAVTSLEAIAFGAAARAGERLVALLPAGKNEVFVQVDVGAISHVLVADLGGVVFSSEGPWAVVGSGADLGALPSGARRISGRSHDSPLASVLAAMARSREPVSVDGIEPLYVRAPDITKPKG